MSVVKSKRSQSKIEFEMLYFQVVDGVDNLVKNQFYTDAELQDIKYCLTFN